MIRKMQQLNENLWLNIQLTYISKYFSTDELTNITNSFVCNGGIKLYII